MPSAILTDTFYAKGVKVISPVHLDNGETTMFKLPGWVAEDCDISSPGVYLFRVHREEWSRNIYVGTSSNVYRRLWAYSKHGSHKKDLFTMLKMDRYNSGLSDDPCTPGKSHYLEIRVAPLASTEKATETESKILLTEREHMGLPWNVVKSGGLDPDVRNHCLKVIGSRIPVSKKQTEIKAPASSTAKFKVLGTKIPVAVARKKADSHGPALGWQCMATAKSTGKQCRRKRSPTSDTCSLHH